MDRAVVCTELVALGLSHGQQHAQFAMALAMETIEWLDASCAPARGTRRTREAGGKEAGAMRVCLSSCLSLETETEREIELAGDSDNPPTHTHVCVRALVYVHTYARWNSEC